MTLSDDYYLAATPAGQAELDQAAGPRSELSRLRMRQAVAALEARTPEQKRQAREAENALFARIMNRGK
jgi:hypothetical protein